ncbi:hypothetical protein Q7472_10710 [Glaesserella parasuis]|uniref:hypothetical protein n=1 Tax=Glaesserella parasuis TaxID=738 RepID=UPI0013654B48|nr:hypothetical protein [Glaesserella parasuis]MCT8560426.1 hypothetical protein [Glaesserella parasuis]MCT8829440.1 hypothetical protein [Glaesserella parasuis]MCT8833681.1 hypothetical protein [Glaesserella parasuis]MDE3933405.1 hypothetical protein [Glaesserella parasuis]MDE3944690.1 hypothetical protein [Glaesserella parasuis]
MHIKHWKKIAFLASVIMHYSLWHFNVLKLFEVNELRDLLSDLFTSSSTLIGFIFAIIAILVTISEHSLIKVMRENGMYAQIMQHLKYLISGFSISMLFSYVGTFLSGKWLIYCLLFTSFVFMYSMIMLVTGMFRRLTLTFTNLK